jgi:hypothetical protein
MANRDLLKEAIADAKSVKEAAIANAKAALEEAFTPYLKEKFSAKLAEMEAEEMDEAKEEMDENTSKEEMEEMSNPVMRKGLKGDDTEEKRTEKMREEEETMDEMDLDELLAELDEEMGKDKEMEETLNEQEEEEMEMDSEEEVEGKEEDEIDLEDMTEEELKDLIEDVIEDMVRAGELEAGEEFESDEDEEEDIDIDMEDEEEMVAERAYYGKNKGDKPRKSTAKEKDELLKNAIIARNIDAETDTILSLKGLEKECVLWSTRIPLEFEREVFEFSYTIVTRTSCILIIAITDNTQNVYKKILGLLNNERLIMWDRETEQKFATFCEEYEPETIEDED